MIIFFSHHRNGMATPLKSIPQSRELLGVRPDRQNSFHSVSSFASQSGNLLFWAQWLIRPLSCGRKQRSCEKVDVGGGIHQQLWPSTSFLPVAILSCYSVLDSGGAPWGMWVCVIVERIMLLARNLVLPLNWSRPGRAKSKAGAFLVWSIML